MNDELNALIQNGTWEYVLRFLIKLLLAVNGCFKSKGIRMTPLLATRLDQLLKVSIKY